MDLYENNFMPERIIVLCNAKIQSTESFEWLLYLNDEEIDQENACEGPKYIRRENLLQERRTHVRGGWFYKEEEEDYGILRMLCSWVQDMSP